MPNIRVCALFRPLNAKEISDHGDTVCIRAVDSDSFVLKVENAFSLWFICYVYMYLVIRV